jgi:hypothetical protein
MIGATLGFVFGVVAYTAAAFFDVMPFGHETVSAGITCGILGAGIEVLIRKARKKAAN